MRRIRLSAAIITYIFAANLVLAIPPTANTDSYSVNEGNTLTVSAAGVLANDFDLDGPLPIVAVNASTPSHGSLTLNSDGSFTYIHDGSETTFDVFYYQAYDGAEYSSSAAVNITINPVNDPPEAQSVAISGTLETEETLTGTYTYYDPEGNPEGATTYAWYRANDDGGSGAAAISGATSQTYTTVFADGGKYVQFRVTPRDNQGGVGTTAVSDWEYINAAPVASNLDIEGILAVGETITADFDYGDLESNPAGSHSIIWYRSSTGTGSGTQVGTGNTYVLSSPDNEKYIRFTITPVATAGSSPGQLVESDWVLITDLAVATISGLDSICNDGSLGDLTISVLGGDSPWEVVYAIDSTPQSTPVSISTSPYTLSRSTAGEYTLVSVEDDNGYSGTVSGTGYIRYYTDISASINGTKSICPGMNDSIAVYLNGTAPWSFTYTRNGGSPTVISGVQSSPAYIPISSTTAGTYALTAMNDAHCDGTVSGSVVVSIKTSPRVELESPLDPIFICPEEDTTLVINRISGNYPLTVTYAIDGMSQTPIDITEETYNLLVDEAGVYTLVSVSDNTGDGCVSGTAEIDHHPIPTATISGTYNFCEGSSVTVPVTLTGSPRFYVTYTLGGGSPVTVDGTSSPLNLVLHPVESTTLALTVVSDLNCPGDASGTASLTEIAAPDVTISNLDDFYSSDETQITFNYSPLGGDFDDSDTTAILIDQHNGSCIFSPAISGSENSPHKVVYKYQAGTGCWGRDSVIVSVLDDLGQIDIISDKKDVYCFNDGLIKLRGINVESYIGSFSIEGGVGLVDSANNIATVDPTVIRTGSKTVTYNFMIGGSPETATLDLDFEELISDFTWDNECFNEGAVIHFEGLGTGDSDLEYFYWDLYFPDTTLTLEGEDTTYSFDAIGTYRVDYIIESENACRDTATKNFTLRQTISIEDDPYTENFETGAGQWVAKRLGTTGPNSWTLGTPDNGIMHGSTNNESWFTDIENRSLVESSYVVSPCFSFEELDRPMIKMDIWRAFDQRRDGAVLQYSLNDGTGWKNVGQLDDGIEWYNSYQIQGVPGGQPVGWAEDVDNRWKEACHDLNDLAGEPSVRLRVAYGSDGTGISNEGFAFDNIWICNRKKRILLEHFTNAGDTVSKNANEKVNTAVNSMSQDVIDIQYHTAFPGNDPFYDHNPGVPNSRELYYNLEGVPFGLIDGGRNNQTMYTFDYDEHDLTALDLKLAVLEDNLFDIDLKAAVGDDYIVIETEITALDTISERVITLHHVVLEHLIKDEVGDNGETRFESVAKDMVPNTFGTDYERAWLPGESEQVSYIWSFENVYDDEELRVVAFIQDETTKRIYQAAKSFLDDDITDIEEIEDEKKHSFTLYPNPSDGNTWIQLSEILHEPLVVDVFDNTSRLIYSEKVNGLTNTIFLPLNNMKPGIYFVRLSSKEKIFMTEKLVVTRAF